VRKAIANALGFLTIILLAIGGYQVFTNGMENGFNTRDIIDLGFVTFLASVFLNIKS
jgi:TRAP-type C4-dicarboxylate transport system permease small subunit